MGAQIARGAVRGWPECPDLYILGAYMVRRAEDVRAALEFLRSGEPCMADVANYWFNVGCYHCQLGDLDEAKACVKKAVGLDRRFRKMALEDADLEPLWDELGSA
jgi:Tfp pilus assembly protein PilF